MSTMSFGSHLIFFAGGGLLLHFSSILDELDDDEFEEEFDVSDDADEIDVEFVQF